MKKPIDVVDSAKAIIEEQTYSLLALKKRLDFNFNKIIEAIIYSKGKLVVLGLGKSGVIGKKIAATLNSTGTKAMFIHASDALHGDLGGIDNKDVILFLSKSGNTSELKQLMQSLKNRSSKIITMTCNTSSYLALHSDYVIDISIEKEACPNNLAPTTSTTLQLVMGDVLALTLVKLKNFKKEDFARLHPGGAIGKRLSVKVLSLCNNNNTPFVMSNDNLKKIILEISSKRLGATAVMEDKKIVGIITDGDLRRMLEKDVDIKNVIASDLMTKSPKTIKKDALASHALNKMNDHGITQLLIMSNKEYVGIIHLHDILRHNIF